MSFHTIMADTVPTFEEVFLRHQVHLRNYVRTLVRDRDLADDVFQDVSLILLDPFPAAAFPLDDIGPYLAQFLAFGLIALLVVLPATFGGDGPGRYRQFLRHPIPTWLGLISYGIFLWQFPVLIALGDIGVVDHWQGGIQFPAVALLTLGGTIVCAAISYYGLERPLMLWGKRRFGSSAPEPAGSEVAP